MRNFGEITVLVANYNCEEFLARAITSVVNQSYPFWRACIIDDNSPNQAGFLAVKRSFTDPRLKWFKTDKNVGQYRIYNHFLPSLTTPYFALQDADDFSQANRFECLIKLLRLKGGDLVGSAVKIITPEEQRIRHLPANVNRALLLGFRRGLFFGGTMLGKSEFIRQMGGFDGNTRFAGDSELIYRAVFKGKILNHQEALYNYCIRPHSLTQSQDTGFNSIARKKYAAEIRKKFHRNFLRSHFSFRMNPLQLGANPNDLDFIVVGA